ncbi:ufm1-specific protease 2-like [Branchiostoma lanceolatum]|uniref:ufm1-specific protease 2-like n=1 Tax=Branchiostoma lanceolatum TaxID=7740 RepID=UPI0034536884
MAAKIVHMLPVVKKQVKQQIKVDDPGLLGFLLGIPSTKTGIPTVVGLGALVGSDGTALQQEAEDTLLHLPAGIRLAGVAYTSEKPPTPDYVSTQCLRFVQAGLKDVFVTNEWIVQHIQVDPTTENEGDVQLSKLFLYDSTSGSAAPVDVREVEDSSLLSTTLLLRLQGQLSLEFEYNPGEDDDMFKAIEEGFRNLQEKIATPATIFHLTDTDVLLRQHETVDATSLPLSYHDPCHRLLQFVARSGTEELPKKGGNKDSKARSNTQDVLSMQLLFQQTGLEAMAMLPSCVPIIHSEKRNFHNVCLPVSINVTAYIHRDDPVSRVPQLMVEAVSRQLRGMEACLNMHFQGGQFCVPAAYHFLAPGMPHLLTAVYPSSLPDDTLEWYRKDLHQRFSLPADRPLLRRQNAYVFPEDQHGDIFLTNPHEGLPPSGAKGDVTVVQGRYRYHHYMQDRMNDSGWGCAYRSLQTICSWYNLQGYTDRTAPTHREIQQALVDVGDKPVTFVGSRKWIGSIEVSTCLNQLLGVTSRIMFVSSGADLGGKGRELALHFQTQGTPIMIGGGVLAHTILGVDFSDQTGQIKFLILDPHYEGGEDLSVIQGKGWCGWKSVDFWDKTTFYNLCLPQRPEII